MTAGTARLQHSVEDEHGTEAQVANEQLRMILAHTALGTFVATAFGVFLAAHLRMGALGASIAPHLVSGWIAVKVAVALLRIVHAQMYRRLGSPTDRSWQHGTTALLAVDGAVWGVGGAFLMGGSTEVVTFITAALCGVASVATFGLQVRLLATAAYVIPIIAPLSLALIARGDDMGLMSGVGVVMLMALLLSTARRWEKRMEEVFRLRIVTERVSQERAEALELARIHSTAKDRFLAVVSHELRTPLHGILGLTRLARSEVPRADAALHYRLELIEEAGDHLQRMVNDLLDISSIEGGRLELKAAPVELAREIRLLQETYRARAEEAGIRFTVVTSADADGTVMGDSLRIAQVLHNLLGNAFKFTPLGGSVSLHISRQGDSDMVQFDVRDNGPGIAADEAQRLFDTFTQGSTRTGSRPDGVGLGLAIARQLARAMDGEVICTSELGKGSCFSFTAKLPLTESPALPPAEDKASAGGYRAAGHTVAIADDDELSALVSMAVVRKLGCDYEEFGDGKSLVVRMQRGGKRPDLIIMDWDMPHMDGRQATLLIREHEELHGLPRIPIIGLSANASPTYAVDAFRAGMDEFVEKPCAPADLAELVRSFLDKTTAIQPVPSREKAPSGAAS